MVDRGEVRRLNLAVASVRGDIKNITTNDQLKALFRKDAQ